ncbi:prolyl oligopeptidase family serine peptidase [Flavobacterium dankookense]|uniref:Prolyl oligopeptidase n=1 Tax=Flavobacterium dankookense TaxID=706186 RepID=A0A4R6Q6F5_9FLAO|nr:prolyl oligopeptidase family serine peptidase [Flavobacterium dankookense]TDP57590.1 prolyl oligopeptidase [Flavobacterium dankookense]
MAKYTLLLLAIFGINNTVNAQEDKYLWLEEVDGEKALSFVNEQNKATFDKLSKEKDYQSIYDQCLAIFNSSERIAYPSINGNYVYNFWKDKNHERGIWRRCLLTDYKSGKLNWETLLDIDELSKKDNKKWVFKGASGLHPTYTKFLISLSNGGGDATIIREFDVDKKAFIKDGFQTEEAKGWASYVDENTIAIATNFGEKTMTDSGYPRLAKLWKRGTSLDSAQLIYEGKKEDVGVWCGVYHDGSKTYTYVSRAITIFNSEKLFWHNNQMVSLDIPLDADINSLLNDQLIVTLKSDWKVENSTFKSGTLISLTLSELLKGKKSIKTIIVPDEFSSVDGVATTKNKVLINMLSNVTNKLFVFSFDGEKWQSKQVKAPEYGTIGIITTDDTSDEYFFNFQNFITPSTLFAADAKENTLKEVKSLPAFFDASKYEVKQYKAKSKDGTLVPYFLVAAKNLKTDGNNPTLIYAYGGFGSSSQPYYASAVGVSWLDKGGVYVLANIRGGGEFGPNWHQAGLKEKRQNVFDDLYAVSEDVIAKKITSSKHLGVMGGSNGGLLVGVAFTQRPELYNAIVCEVPLLDMQRYNKLLAGASWMGEYGNPDIPEEWEYIKKYSPYQNLKAEMNYPEVFFTTSTRDDRVHPGHARKMVAKMNDMGYKTFYYENMEGGHAGASTNEQTAKIDALIYSYLLKKLK